MDQDQLGVYQSFTMRLRSAGMRAEMYLGSSGMRAQMKYADKRGAPCVVIHGEDERARGDRMVCEGEFFVALTPYASRFPFEMWVLPRSHEARFEDQSGKTLGDLANVMYTVLSSLDRALDMPAYNTIVHTAPFRMPDSEDYHWHIEIIPRMTGVAGYEWGTGAHINPVAPESAAEMLRAL